MGVTEGKLDLERLLVADFSLRKLALKLLYYAQLVVGAGCIVTIAKTELDLERLLVAIFSLRKPALLLRHPAQLMEDAGTVEGGTPLV